MNFGKFQELWNDFIFFLDRSFQWLMYLFDPDKENSEWKPENWPIITK